MNETVLSDLGGNSRLWLWRRKAAWLALWESMLELHPGAGETWVSLKATEPVPSASGVAYFLEGKWLCKHSGAEL